MYKINLNVIPAPELNENYNLAYLMINLVSSKGQINIDKIVLDNIRDFEWFKDNESYIRNELFPIEVDNKLSIAEAINYFIEKIDLDSDVDEQLDALYEYRTRHGIRFAFRGQRIANIYIGLKNGIHEISCDEEDNFRYEVDIDSLFSQVSKIHGEYLNLMSGMK